MEGRPQKLGFIVFGVPRPGTTAPAGALNVHPEVFCAPELLGPDVDHGAACYPAGFRRGDDDRGATPTTAAALAELRAHWSSLRWLGNKQPRYDRCLDRVVRQHPDLQLFCLWRDLHGVYVSWTARARDPDDPWHPGATGPFAGLEVLACLQAGLAPADRVTLLTADGLLAPEGAGVSALLHAIGAGCSEDIRAACARDVLAAPAPRQGERDDRVRAQLMAAAEPGRLLEIVASAHLAAAAQVHDARQQSVRAHAAAIAMVIEGWLAERPPAALDYLFRDAGWTLLVAFPDAEGLRQTPTLANAWCVAAALRRGGPEASREATDDVRAAVRLAPDLVWPRVALGEHFVGQARRPDVAAVIEPV